MRRILVIIGLLSMMLYGCHPKGDTANNTATDSIVEILSNYTPTQDEGPRTLSSTFTCDVQGVRVNGLLRIQKDSIIWATASKIIELGRVKLTPDSIYVYVKIDNSFYANDYKIMGRDINFYQIQDMLIASATRHASFQLPIKGQHIQISFNRITYPNQLTFPFSIPANAEPIILPEEI